MLVQYTAVSSLTQTELDHLKSILPRMVLEGRSYIDFFGKYLSINDLQRNRHLWEQAPSTRRPLFE